MTPLEELIAIRDDGGELIALDHEEFEAIAWAIERITVLEDMLRQALLEPHTRM